jgi:glucosamine--fructose-6-phosphate aminotransferase (isomerizing)
MPTEHHFDPTAALPGPPDPWAYTGQPSLRAGPPYHMTEMIAAEAALAGRLLGRDPASNGVASLAAAIRDAARAGEPVVVTGCGTSEHGAQGFAEVVRHAMRTAGLPKAAVQAEQALEVSLDPPIRGLVIGISHEGGTGATNGALAASRAAGARTALVTASRRSPGGSIADIVVETGELDQSWCHTVGYLSPLLVAAAVGSILSGRTLDAQAVGQLLAAGTRDTAGAERIASELAGAEHLLVVASGADRPAGRELVLKVEEASWLPSAYRDLETFLHGHLPATGPETGLVLVLADRAGRAERLVRARQVLAAAREIGLRSAAILAADLGAAIEPSLTPAGRLLVAEAGGLPAPVAALMGTATPLQLLTERLARARGTNPDPIRRDDPTYLRASNAADAADA